MRYWRLCQSVNDGIYLRIEVDPLHSASGFHCARRWQCHAALLAHRFLLPWCPIQLPKLLIGLRAASFGTRQVKNLPPCRCPAGRTTLVIHGRAPATRTPVRESETRTAPRDRQRGGCPERVFDLSPI